MRASDKFWSTEYVVRQHFLVMEPRNADARDFGLDRTEEGLVNIKSRMPQNQHCRTNQAIRDRNH